MKKIFNFAVWAFLIVLVSPILAIIVGIVLALICGILAIVFAVGFALLPFALVFKFLS